MTVEYGYSVVVRQAVAGLGVNRSREAVVFVYVVVEIKIILFLALCHGIVYIRIRNVYPRVNVRVHSRQFLKVDQILLGIRVYLIRSGNLGFFRLCGAVNFWSCSSFNVDIRRKGACNIIINLLFSV